MNVLDPHDPRDVAHWAARAVVDAGVTCKLWLAWKNGGPGWHVQPGLPAAGSARCYAEVGEMTVDQALAILDGSGFWHATRLAIQVRHALDAGQV